MAEKYIFFDADGTILDIKRGIPEDAKLAIRQLVANGHKAFLCTGRSRAFIPKEALELPFSGIISNMGAYIEYQGKPVYDFELPLDTARHAMEVLRQNGLVPVMEGNAHMYYDLDEYTTEVDWFADLITQVLGDKHRTIRGNEDNLHINKISAKRLPGCNAEKAVSELSDIFDAIWHEGAFVGSTVEMIAKGHSKGIALAVLTGVLGVDFEDTVAFGDSNNDIDMFKAVKTKVAMGDATPEMIRMASFVTEPLFEGGISNGLRKLGVI